MSLRSFLVGVAIVALGVGWIVDHWPQPVSPVALAIRKHAHLEANLHDGLGIERFPDGEVLEWFYFRVLEQKIYGDGFQSRVYLVRGPESARDLLDCLHRDTSACVRENAREVTMDWKSPQIGNLPPGLSDRFEIRYLSGRRSGCVEATIWELAGGEYLVLQSLSEY